MLLEKMDVAKDTSIIITTLVIQEVLLQEDKKDLMPPSL